MRVYRFLPSIFALKTIQEKRLYISRVNNLNDPFEFLSVNLGNKMVREAMHAVKSSLDSRGLICFSDSWSNPLLWSHYADKHKGICIGLEYPTDKLTKILYSNKRVPIKGEIDIRLMDQILSTKFRHWRYESEYRSFLSLDTPDKEGNYYLNFSQEVQLKEVIVGINSTVSRNDIQKVIGSNSEDICMFKVRAAFQSFKIVKNKKDGLWQ